MKGLVAETSSLLHVSLPSRIELVIREVPEAAVISGQPGQLQQVILNLCNNAAQAMDQAGRVEIETEVHLLRPGAVVINDARGPILDLDALLAHLKSGHIATGSTSGSTGSWRHWFYCSAFRARKSSGSR
jgi:signal transduction histidine kinase